MTLNSYPGLMRQSFNLTYPAFIQDAIAAFCLAVTGTLITAFVLPNRSWASPVQTAGDGVGTIVNLDGNRFEIRGGQTSGDGMNLFHSFNEFGLSAGQIADFLPDPGIQNILGRVTGGNISVIDGLIQVSDSSANLFLINPAGILFGPNAQLDLSGSFTATTATGIGLNDNWFNAFGENNYDLLTGDPTWFAFDLNQPGAIINTGNLAVSESQSVTLLGGTVINTGTLSAPGGEIVIAAVPGENLVRVSQENLLLSLEFETIDTATNPPDTFLPPEFSPLSLPALLTGGLAPGADDITVNPDGTVQLTATGTIISNESSLAIASGTLDTSSNLGGEIGLAGNQVSLVNGSVNAPLTVTADALLEIATSDIDAGQDDVTLRSDTDLQITDSTIITQQGNVTIHADVDGDGQGSLNIDNSEIATNEGGFSAIGRGNVPEGESEESIQVSNSVIRTDDSDIHLSGEQGTVLIVASSIETTGTGQIVLQGIAGDSNDDDTNEHGVFITDDTSITSEAGSITVDGTGGTTGFNTNGMVIDAGSEIRSTTGDILLVGQGGNDRDAQGISIGFNGDTIISSIDGDITLIGTAGDNDPDTMFGNHGLLIFEGGTVETSGQGNVILEGTGGVANDEGQAAGVLLQGRVNSSGAVDIVGQPGSGSNQPGVVISGTLESAGALSVESDSDIDIDGLIATQDSVNFRANNNINFDINSSIVAQESVDFQAENINVSGSINAQESVDFQAENEINIVDAAIAAQDSVNFQTSNDIDIDNTEIVAQDDATFLADGLARFTASTINTNGGDFILIGNEKVLIQTSIIEAIETGEINIVGGDGTGGVNHGVLVRTDSILSTEDGKITLTGIGGIAGDNTNGILVGTNSVVRSETGDIRIEGNGGEGEDAQGLTIGAGGQIQSVDGDIELIGIAGTEDPSNFNGNYGVLIFETAIVESLGAGKVSINGVGGIANAPDAADGVSVQGSIRSAGSGTINISGQGGIGSDHLGISISGVVESTGSGDIFIEGQGDRTDAAAFEIIDEGLVLTNNNDLTITATDIELDATAIIDVGSGNVNLRPLDPTYTIGVGDNAAGAFNLNTTELTTNLASSGTVSIGSPDFTGTGGVTLSNLSDLANEDYNLTVRGGDITFHGSTSSVATLQLADDKTAQFISSNTIWSSSSTDIRIGGENGAVLLDAANGILGNGTDGITVDVTRIAARTRNSGDIEIRFTAQESDSVSDALITSVGGVDGIKAAADGDISISSSTELNSITVEQPVETSGTGMISIGGPNTAITRLNNRITSETGDLVFANAIEFGGGEQIISTTAGDIRFTESVRGDQRLTLTTQEGAIYFQDLDSVNNSPKINVAGLSLNARTVDIDVPVSTNGHSVDITALTSITTGDILTQSDDGRGGDILLSSPGAIATGNLNSSGPLGGGNITVQSGTSINTSIVDSSSSLFDGGDVILDPPGDIQVTSINTQGGSSGSGGDVTVVTEQFFRSDGSFIDQNNVDASISTAGGIAGGNILIFHGGGDFGVPFDVGNAALNGTAGAITTGVSNAITPFQSFPGSYFQNNIGIITTDITDRVTPQIVTLPPEVKEITTLVGELVFQIEDLFTRDYEDYFERSDRVSIKSLEEIQLELNQVQSLTDNEVRPAIIYAFFIAPGIDLEGLEQEINRFEEYDGATSLSPENEWQFAPDDLASQYSALRQMAVQDANASTGQLALLMITGRNQPIFRAVGITMEEVEQDIQNLRSELSAYNEDSEWDVPARSLYSYLIEPLEVELEKLEINNLLFITDTKLRTVPFATLHELHSTTVGEGEQGDESRSVLLPTLLNGEGNFLIERYSIGLVPTASLTDLSYRSVNREALLVMGTDKEFADAQLPDLLSVPTEMNYLKNQWNGVVEVIGDDEGEQFTAESFLSALQQESFTVVHLATHAEFNPGDASNSAIYFEDRPLTLTELPAMNLKNIDLLVLSACQTAIGNREAELGFAGIAYQAGVKSTLAALNSVSDEGTAALMAQFYANLQSTPIKAEALREAQLAMLRGDVSIRDGQIFGTGILENGFSLEGSLAELENKQFRHPYFWAWFTIVGSPW